MGTTHQMIIRRGGMRTTVRSPKSARAEVQQIGLGFVQSPKVSRAEKPSLTAWLGKRLERIGRRLQQDAAARV